MAAEVTLVTVPDGLYRPPMLDGLEVTARELIDINQYKVKLDDDVFHYDDDGELAFVEVTDRRFELSQWVRELGDWIEIGSWSPMKAGLGLDRCLPRPQVAVYNYIAPGRRITPGLRAKVMNQLSYPEGDTIYGRPFKLRHRRSNYHYYSKNHPAHPDLARRPVKKFLTEHMGDWVIAESW